MQRAKSLHSKFKYQMSAEHLRERLDRARFPAKSRIRMGYGTNMPI